MPKINPRIKSIDDLLGLDAAEESPIEPTLSTRGKRRIADIPQQVEQHHHHPSPAGHSCFPRPSVPAV